MAKPAPLKPHVDLIKQKIDLFCENLIQNEVIPYLQHLLNIAQAKTEHRLELIQGMGTSILACTHPKLQASGGWNTIDDALDARGYPEQRCDPKVLRLREKFPELIEFMEIVYGLSAYYQDDLHPTALRQNNSEGQDPVDYVEDGPIVGCGRRGCKFTGVEADFIYVEDNIRLCETCANRRKTAKLAKVKR